MATQDSTNPAQAGKTPIQALFDEIREHQERAYALVLAIQAQLPHDLDPILVGGTSTTAHLVNLLDDLLNDHALLNAFEDLLAGAHRKTEVAA